MEYIIGIDLGTTSTKTILFNLNGEIKESSNLSYPLYQDQTGMAEEAPKEIFSAVIKGLHEVISHSQVNPKDIKGISFSAAMHSLILMDKNNQPLTRVITWADNRAAKYADELKLSSKGNEFFQKTGVPIHPMSPLIKLLWLKSEYTELFSKAKKIIGIKDYILFRLFGHYVSDYSLANATGLFNIHTMDWDEEILKFIGISRDQLPDLVDTEYQLVGLDKIHAKEIGIDRQTPFIIGASDGTLSNLGLDAINPGNIAVTIGTSGAVRSVIDQPFLDKNGRLFTYYLAKNCWIIGGPVNNGGITFAWVRDQLFNSENISYDTLTKIAANIPAGSNGLLFHPYLGGERAPIWNANARGSFFGLTSYHSRNHLTRSVLEGICYNLNFVLSIIKDVIGTPTAIKAAGGFAHSDLWCQILTDVFRQNIDIPKSIESSAFGAAILGLHSLGIIKNLSDVKNMISVPKSYKPNDANSKIYQELIPIWTNLLESMNKNYDAISNFQRNHFNSNNQISEEN